MEGETTKYKIEFADVRLTPEQLKVVEDKIDYLEKESHEAKELIKRFDFFLKKLSQVLEMNQGEIESILTSDLDYDVHASSQISSDRILIRFRQKP